MGFKPKEKTFLLEFEDEEYEGLEIEMRSLDVGSFLTLNKLTSKKDPSEAEMAAMFKIFAKGIKSWNVEGGDGVVWPTTYASVLKLDTDFVISIISAWLGGAAGVDEDLGKDSTSGEKSPVPLPTMEAL